MDRVKHDCAWGCMVGILDSLEILRASRKFVAFRLYRALVALLEVYDLQREREYQRLHPSQN